MRERIERALGAWGHLAYRHPWRIIVSMLVLVAIAATQLPKLQFDTSTEGFFREDDPVRVEYDVFRERFGMDTMILLAMGPDAAGGKVGPLRRGRW